MFLKCIGFCYFAGFKNIAKVVCKPEEPEVYLFYRGQSLYNTSMAAYKVQGIT